MPRQAERSLPSFAFHDIRVIAKKKKSPDNDIIFDNDDDLDDVTRDRLGLLRRSDHVGDGHKVSIALSAGGDMRQGTPFSSFYSNNEGANYSSEQSQQTSDVLAAQDEALDKLSTNLGRLQSVSAEITSEMSSQEVLIQEVSSIAERAENAVNDITRRVQGIVKKHNAESWIPKVVWVLIFVGIVEFLYLIYF